MLNHRFAKKSKMEMPFSGHILFSGWLQYAKLAISLRVPGGGKKKAVATPQGGTSGEPAANEEEDEYEGGLC